MREKRHGVVDEWSWKAIELVVGVVVEEEEKKSRFLLPLLLANPMRDIYLLSRYLS